MSNILPVIGSSGYYELAAPFDALAVNNVEYTCMAIRRFRDYVANNEDIKTSIYAEYKLDDKVYEEDMANDAYIVSLQSRTGHWLYVPSRYILTYPSPNGIKYRALMIGVSLPPIPVSQNIDALISDIKALTEARLGATVGVKTIETSKVFLVDEENHTKKQIQRSMARIGDSSSYSTQVRLERENEVLRAKVTALEDYIKTHP